MKALASILLVLFVTGCSQLGPIKAARTAAVQQGQLVTDDMLQSSVWYICEGATVGSVRRMFGNNVDAWRELCAGQDSFTPVEMPNGETN